MRAIGLILLLAGSVTALFAQRALIGSRSIVNAGSFMAPGLPGGPIAQGSIFTIFGTLLGPSSSPALAFPLSTNLGGVSIKVIQGSTSVDAIPLFVSPTQINAIMPSNAPLGAVSLQVTTPNGSKTQPALARIAASGVGIFAVNSAGLGPGVFQNYVGASLPLNSPASAAMPGQFINVYGTGLGPVSFPDNIAPTAGNLPTKVEVFVGGQSATVAYSGRSSCCAGLDQIVFTVPAAAPLGCWVPVQIRTQGTIVSNTVTMSISADGSPCSDAANALTQPFLAGKKFGLIALLRSAIREDVGLKTPGTVTTDTAMVAFQQESATQFGFNPVFSLPPAGACTAYTATGDLFTGDAVPGAGTTGKFLNAGTPLTLTGTGKRNIPRPTTNARNYQPLGYTYDGSLVPSTLFLNPGNLTLAAPGGPDVAAFTASVTVPSPLTWTNRDQTTTIGRSQGFTVNWTGAPAGQSVIIFGGGVDTPSNASAVFACVAPAGASSFTVPATALANIAATRNNLLLSKGSVWVGALPTTNPTAFSAAGLDSGMILPGAFTGKTVIFQ